MKQLLLALCLLLPLAAQAQKKENFFTDLNDFLEMRSAKNYARQDTNYVARYPYIWDTRTFYYVTSLHIKSEGAGDVNLYTGVSNRVGLSFGYRGLALSYSFALGRKLNFDFGLSSYGTHFGFEYNLRATTSLQGTIATSGMPEAIGNNEITLFASNLNLLYNLNPRFSYAAAMKQSRIQRKSAGSFIIAASWTVWDVLGAGSDIISRKTSIQTLLDQPNLLYDRISIGAGYGYNLVFGKEHWLLHASFIPMWTFYEASLQSLNGVRTKARHPMGHIAFMGTGRVGAYYRWGTRWSVGLSGIINQMVSRNGVNRSKEGFTRFGTQDFQARLQVGFRF